MEKMILWDCHMHSEFSGDCEVRMDEMARKAAELGLKGICFTEHLDPDYPDTPDGVKFDLNLEDYHRGIELIQEKFRGKLEVLFGVELGLQPQLEEYFRDLIKKEDFDLVIGSSHVVHGADPYYPAFFEGRKEFYCYMEYFESILENLAFFSEMDVFGHLDYIVRYGKNKDKEYSYGRYQDILDEILKTLLKKGCGIELNTGGLHYGLKDANPSMAVLKRYRQLGGEIITIGSDAHKPEHVGFSFDRAAEILKECGFSYYTVFKERKPIFLPVD